ncbi:universal stress protein [Neolewinella antarctica]|uniref:Nucleotide-binding universal stress UspA family protein n=1 Tax=Neolewinella antarctica TaxID=442734 RepID=A0ABX0X8Z7_9BACT|nr:universal stress protein [Neolewinella antarctica]NJC25741.1 nucleotide-binding universal stress UspA family protein [Neolewinella antarctica]
MIKKILVPIDFSVGSASALRYAEAMAASIQAVHVRAIHVFTPQTASADAITAAPVGELMDLADEAMVNFLDGIPVPDGVNRQHELLLGFSADKIIEESKAYDLIVMGSSGSSDLLDEVFGSVASTVVDKATCPVILVPRGTVFQNYKNVLYASNNLSLSRRAVLEFRAFNKLFHARVHFVHVKEEEDDKDLNRQAIFAKLFSTPDPSFSFDIREIEAESVQEGLREYLERHPIELAVMVTRRRGFWGRLFHHSDTRQMILHPLTPVMVLHVVD